MSIVTNDVCQVANLSIVGFDGSARLGPCGRALPIIHDAEHSCYYVAPSEDYPQIPSSVFDDIKFQQFAEQERITLFPELLAYIANPVAVYARRDFLDAVGINPTASSEIWLDVADSVVARCEKHQVVEHLMNTWGKVLHQKAVTTLSTSNSGISLKERLVEADRLLDWARRSARDQDTRLSIFEWMGAILLAKGMEERFKQLFDAFIRPSHGDIYARTLVAAREHYDAFTSPVQSQPTKRVIGSVAQSRVRKTDPTISVVDALTRAKVGNTLHSPSAERVAMLAGIANYPLIPLLGASRSGKSIFASPSKHHLLLEPAILTLDSSDTVTLGRHEIRTVLLVAHKQSNVISFMSHLGHGHGYNLFHEYPLPKLLTTSVFSLISNGMLDITTVTIKKAFSPVFEASTNAKPPIRRGSTKSSKRGKRR